MVELSKHKISFFIHTIFRINETVVYPKTKHGAAGEKTMEVYYHGKFKQNK